MARKKSSPARTDASHDLLPSPHLAAWVALTWDDLRLAFDRGSVQRGRAYQRDGHVSELLVSQEGELLGAVQGTHLYVTNVKLVPKKRGPERIQGHCSCPLGGRCKHAVAVVADYLAQLADGKSPPLVSTDDARWKRLLKAHVVSDEEPDDDDDGADFEDEYDDDVDDSEVKGKRATRTAGGTRGSARQSRHRKSSPTTARKSGRRTRAEWDALILADLKKKSVDELAQLVISLIGRFPKLRQEFQERLLLSEGDATRLIREARKELRSVTAETGWRNHWDDDGHTPDYDRLKGRLEKLVEIGQADAVADLGRDLFKNGMLQVAESDDDGATASALAECFPVVFAAVAGSSMTPADKILYAIDACEMDEWNYIEPAAAEILESNWSQADWSAVADRLAERLNPRKPEREVTPRDEKVRAANESGGEAAGAAVYSRTDYRRSTLSNWLALALERSGRDDEILPLFIIEASRTGDYERLVDHLMKLKRFDDAERWAREGIEKSSPTSAGLVRQLVEKLVELARRRRQWDVVAAQAACDFFSRPRVDSFQRLMSAAKKAKCETIVRRRAEQFLETGIAPIRRELVTVEAPRTSDATRAEKLPKQQRGKSAPAKGAIVPMPSTPPAPPAFKTIREDDWPLPLPDYMATACLSADKYGGHANQYHQVLVELAIAEDRMDDALRWYDSITGGKSSKTRGSIGRRRWHFNSLDDQVAEAVAKTHPERSLEIYRRDLDANLQVADAAAYDQCATTLRMMHPIMKAIGREREWNELVQSIREKYRNRPRFMDVLDSLDPRPIIETRKRGK